MKNLKLVDAYQNDVVQEDMSVLIGAGFEVIKHLFFPFCYEYGGVHSWYVCFCKGER